MCKRLASGTATPIGSARFGGRTALLLLGFAVSGFSASFDCAKAQSRTEKLICQNAALSRADEEMAVAYKNALGLASRLAPDDAKDIRTDQIAWLREQVQRCPDRQCLANAYKQRTDALVFYAAHVTRNPADTIAYTGIYTIDNTTGEGLGLWGRLEVLQLPNAAIRFKLRDNVALNSTGSVRSGEATGEVVLKGGVAVYADPDDAECRITMTFQRTKAMISQRGTCGFAMGVVADGTYKKTRNYVDSDLSN